MCLCVMERGSASVHADDDKGRVARDQEQTQRPRKTAEPAAAAGKCDGAGRAASAAGASGAAQEEAHRAAGAISAAHPRHRATPRCARGAALHAAHRRRNGVGHDDGDAARRRPVEGLLGVDGPLHPRSGEFVVSDCDKCSIWHKRLEMRLINRIIILITTIYRSVVFNLSAYGRRY